MAATGGISYSWSPTIGLNNPNISNPIASPTSTTTYTVLVSGAGGCSSSDAVVITVNELPIPTIAGPGEVCSGVADITYTTEVGMNNYSWSITQNGSITSGGTVTDNSVVVDWPNAGAATLTVNYSDNNGCQALNPSEYFINIISSPVKFNVLGGGFFCVGTSGVNVKLENSEVGINYLLLKDNVSTGIVSTGTGSLIDFGIFNQNGTYSIKGSRLTCIEKMDGDAIVTSSDCNYSISLSKDQDGSVYKVKNNNLKFIYKVKYNETGNLNYKIYNSQHVQVTSGHYLTNPSLNFGINNFELNISALSPDIYLMQVENAKNEKWYLKFMVQ